MQALRPRSASLADLPALEAKARLVRGEISAEDLTRACLDRIAERDDAVQAWAYLDPDQALFQARAIDAWRKSGRPTGALHGIPIGVKDIIDTRDMPTENGTPLDAGRRPSQDAVVVQRLRAAGAVILGKTVTTELAVYTPGKTRNPHDSGRTPGGSSSGSAAAVAAGMAPLALGSQTNGSVIRPASFCGVVGFKPSRGLVPRRGVLTQSPTLDTIGTFSRTIEDAALLADVIAGYDDRDPGSEMLGRPDCLAVATSRPPVTPALAFVRSPSWDRADDDVRAGFAELQAALGATITEIELGDEFRRGHEWHRTINLADMARHYAGYVEKGPGAVSDKLQALIEEGLTVRAVDYIRACEGIAILNAGLEQVFERFDAMVTPAAAGEAPVGLESTGDPAFCTLWTFSGAPAATLPLLSGSNKLPIGVQLVGRRRYDGRLLRTARWLQAAILEPQAEAARLASGGTS